MHSHSGVKVFIEQEAPALTRVVNGQTANLTGTHTSIWFRSFLRPQAGLAHMPGNSLTIYCEMLTTHQ